MGRPPLGQGAPGRLSSPPPPPGGHDLTRGGQGALTPPWRQAHHATCPTELVTTGAPGAPRLRPLHLLPPAPGTPILQGQQNDKPTPIPSQPHSLLIPLKSHGPLLKTSCFMHLMWPSPGGAGRHHQGWRAHQRRPLTKDDEAAAPWTPSTPSLCCPVLRVPYHPCRIIHHRAAWGTPPSPACKSVNRFIYWGVLGAQTVPGSQPVCVRREGGMDGQLGG